MTKPSVPSLVSQKALAIRLPVRAGGLTARRLGSRRWLGRGPEADEIGHQAERAFRSGGELTPQPKTDVDPTTLSDFRFDERAAFCALVVRKRVGELDQIGVLRIAAVCIEEIQATLLHPSHPVGAANRVWCIEHGMLRRK